MLTLLEGEVVDSKKIKASPGVVYDVLVFLPNGTGIILSDAISVIGMSGGIFDNTRIVHRTTKKGGKIKYHGNIKDLETTGERVLVGLINGDQRRPVILATLPHPLSIDSLPDPGSLDPQAAIQLQGMKISISPTGKCVISHRGAPTVKPGIVEANYDTKNKTDVTFSDDGSFSIRDSESQKIEINRTNKNIIITNGNDSIFIDKSNNRFVISCNGDIVVSAKGNIQASSDKSIVASCKKNAIVSADGSISLNGSGGKLKLKGNKVALGSNTAELLSSFSEFLDAFTNAALNFVTTPGGPGVLDPILVGKAIEINTKIKAITITEKL